MKKILIATGIYPPKIGGPAQYALNLKSEFEKIGYKVNVATYRLEDKLPTGVRHLFFALKIIPQVLSANIIFALDTFSVGWPTVLVSKIFGKKCVIRTGGDFLWEQYAERTKKKVLLRNFYDTEKGNFTLKEKIILALTRWTLRNASHVIFSTDWQRKIFVGAYNLNVTKTSIVENYYGAKEMEGDTEPVGKEFIGSTRKLVWKNLDVLTRVFGKIPEASLFMGNLLFERMMEKIKNSYAIILVSLGDISPNMILDAIRYNRPFIATKEIGIYERIKEVGVFVDPLDEEGIKKAVLYLLDKDNYEKEREKVRNFHFTHTWEEIAKEFLEIYKKI